MRAVFAVVGIPLGHHLLVGAFGFVGEGDTFGGAFLAGRGFFVGVGGVGHCGRLVDGVDGWLGGPRSVRGMDRRA